MEIKKEHLSLILKIAEYSLNENWSDEQLINFVTLNTIEADPGIMGVFESPADIVNLCYLIDNYYNLEIVCKALIDHRNTMGRNTND